MTNKFLAKVAALGFVVSLLCSGCGTGVTVMAMMSPTISGVSPQVVTAGSPDVTVTVQGSNFQTQAALMVNGAAVPTTFVNPTTLAAKISGSALAQPTVKQLQVKNTDGASSNQVPLTVTDPPQSPSSLAITTAQLPSDAVGIPYKVTFSANGGTQPYSWAVSSGSLPAGLTFSDSGVLSGTPAAVGTSTFAITASDSSSPMLTKTVTLSLSVTAGADLPPALSISSTGLAAAQMSAAYSATLNATGGTPGYSWSITAGGLPAGMTLSNAGVISGTPSSAGTSAFTVAVKDSGSPQQMTSLQESLTVAAPGLAITTTSLSNAKDGSSYTAPLSATGGTPGYTWSISSGTLPPGLSLSSAGVISGTPTASGSFAFTIAVKDSGSPVQSDSAQESIAVGATSAPLTITSASLGAAQTGSSYTATLAATGGTPAYSWSVTSGSLPVGLALSSAGVISGAPTAAGTSTFTVGVSDNGSPSQAASAQESITVSSAQLAIKTVSLGYGTTGTGYSVALAANGGTPGYTWSVASGSLPAGLTLSSAGVISGTPTATGSSAFTVSVSDDGSPVQTATAQESININASTVISPGNAQLYLYPQAPVAPRGSYQTVTAIVAGVNDKTVTWSTDGGTIVGTNPCVVNEPCTVALYTTTPGTYHLRATSNATKSVSATSTITIIGSPTPATSHPRLGGITAAMLPELRAKAVSSNPLYMVLYNNAVTAYERDNQIWSWSCNGGSGQPSSDQSESWKEQDAYLFAFMSMVDPNDSTYKWGCYGRDIWIYNANFWMNPLSSSYTPATLAIRQVDANYGLTGNHGADSTEDLTLAADWLMAGNYLSASDLALTRQYFANAAREMLSIAYTGSRPPVGGYNSSAQFNTGSVWDFGSQRSMGNNYTHSKMMYLVASALTFNDTTTDDPALPNTCNATRYQVCPDGTAGSLHAYWTYFTGAALYKDYAHMEDPTVSWKAYQTAYSNLPTQPTCEDSSTGTQVPCFGDGRGGESAEGSWYQYSMYRLALAMTSVQSAGYNDPMLYGPQLSLSTSSWWDLKAVSDLEFLTYSNGSSWDFLSTGDSLNLFRAPSDFDTQAWMMVNDSMMGRTDRTAALEWPIVATSVGGPSQLVSYDLTNAYGATDAVPMFVSLPAADPAANAPADPRPQMPTDLYNGGNQHILVRSGWDANGPYTPETGDGGKNTAFSFYCANTNNDHEHELCGGFDLLSQGEYITKTRTVFNDYNMTLATAEHSNIAGYAVAPSAPCATLGSCFESSAALGSDGYGGGQFWHGYQAGLVTLQHAELPNYVAAIVDTTNLYNGSAAVGWGNLSGITAASRSLIYLRGSNQIVYYDRGAGAPLAKRVWLTTTGPITLSGQTASWPTRSGKQIAYVSSLLPATAKLSDAGAYRTNENGNPGTTDWEPYSHLLIDAGNPASTQFLTVLEWGSSSSTKSKTVLVQSTAGQNFDGALSGASLVMFMRSWPQAFSTVTYPASGATNQYVSDLTPNTTYLITGAGAPATARTDSAGVLTFTAAGTGSITVAAQ